MGFSWRLQPLSVTRLHVFVFVVDGVRVRTIVIKLCAFLSCVFKCACVCGGLEPRCKGNMFCCHMGLVGT